MNDLHLGCAVHRLHHLLIEPGGDFRIEVCLTALLAHLRRRIPDHDDAAVMVEDRAGKPRLRVARLTDNALHGLFLLVRKSDSQISASVIAAVDNSTVC
jgi:hypothetical protein